MYTTFNVLVVSTMLYYDDHFLAVGFDLLTPMIAINLAWLVK